MNFNVIGQDSLRILKEEKIKKGWTFGALPVIAFDSDLGLKYGGLVNFYNFGDGDTYPDYLQSIYLELSRTTKGSGINQLFFDSEHLLPQSPIRITADLSYLTEKALDFYGFNGFESAYFNDFENDESSSYISRVYYRHERKLFRFVSDFQGRILKDTDNIRWIVGFTHYTHKLNKVDIENLNKGKDENDKLPDTLSLYSKYIKWGIINSKEANGGKTNYLKLGIIYDTRDNESNPMRGLWSELLFTPAPAFLDNNENSFAKLTLTHRQYFTLYPKKLSFAYRLVYQTTIWGNTPFYIQPYIVSSYARSVSSEGLGGARSIRGVLRNRIVGDGIFLGNFEFRWKFIKTVIKNQNFYIALSSFMDMGKVVKKIDIDKNQLPSEELEKDYFNENKDRMHYSLGTGLHFALNENFIVAFDYGMSLDKRDGKDGLYIGLNFLF